MKLLPTVERCNQHEKEPCVVVTIDDDTVYGRSMVCDLLKALRAINYEGAVGFSGFRGDRKETDVQPPMTDHERAKLEQLKRVFPEAECEKALEGFGMVAYMSHLINVPEAQFASSLSRQCFNSDDLVISYSLEKGQIPRFSIPCKMGHPTYMQLLLGYHPDALHM
jgi:hypothetical protein